MAYRGILPQNRSPDVGTQLAQSLGQVTPSIFQTLSDRQALQGENEAIERLTGQNLSGLSPDIKKEFIKSMIGLKGAKTQEKQKSIETGLGTIKRMRELISSAGPSNMIQSFLGGPQREERAELQALGRSLIPLVASGVPIRNQKEFDEYRKIITEPNARQADLEGALKGIENILLRQGEGPEQMSASESEIPVFDVSNPAHKKTRDALMKKFKNNREKVAKELSKHFREE